jgi:hypothetical protein
VEFQQLRWSDNDGGAPEVIAARGLPSLLLGVLLAFHGLGCAERCKREPVGSFQAFLDDERDQRPVRSSSFAGTLTFFLPEDDLGFAHLRIRADDGMEWRIAYRLPVGSLPLRANERYRFRLEYAAGFPDASGLLISDDSGLVFAGVQDQRPSARVFRDGVPGFELALIRSDCSSRQRDRCYKSIRNARLRVNHGQRSAELFHGDSVTLGAYRVIALTVQDVDYSPQCADAGLVALSYAIFRVDTESTR